MYSMRHYGARFIMGEKVERYVPPTHPPTLPTHAAVSLTTLIPPTFPQQQKNSIETLPDRAVVHLSSGKRIAAEGVLYAMGRQGPSLSHPPTHPPTNAIQQLIPTGSSSSLHPPTHPPLPKGNTDTLNLDAVGLDCDRRGLLDVNSYYQTTNPNIYAAGDCIGYPALASTSMEQGRWGGGWVGGWVGEASIYHRGKGTITNPSLLSSLSTNRKESVLPYVGRLRSHT